MGGIVEYKAKRTEVMEITKRDGRKESFDSIKITNAIRKALISVGEKNAHEVGMNLSQLVEDRLLGEKEWNVERILDMVEETLMAQGYFAAAKSFILFRQKRTDLRIEREKLASTFHYEGFSKVLEGIQRDYEDPKYSLRILSDKFMSFLKEGMSENDKETALTKASVELTELLGDNTNVYVDIQGEKSILKVNPHDTPEMDSEITFFIPYSSIYLFDGETEKRI